MEKMCVCVCVSSICHKRHVALDIATYYTWKRNAETAVEAETEIVAEVETEAGTAGETGREKKRETTLHHTQALPPQQSFSSIVLPKSLTACAKHPTHFLCISYKNKRIPFEGDNPRARGAPLSSTIIPEQPVSSTIIQAQRSGWFWFVLKPSQSPLSPERSRHTWTPVPFDTSFPTSSLRE